MAKPKRQLVVVISDTHADYRFGLLPPNMQLPSIEESNEMSPPQYWTPKQNDTQKKLWKWYIQGRDEIKDMAGKDDIYMLHIGDVAQGTILPRQLLVSGVQADQYLIAEEVLYEYAKLKNFRGARFVKGTSVHNGGQGTAEQVVAKSLGLRVKRDIQVWHHMILDLFGVRFDIAHHGVNNSARTWLEGNTLRYYLRDLVSRALKNGERPPDIVLRGHYHDRKIEVLTEHLKDRTVWSYGAICPAFALFMDDYTLKVTKAKPYMTVGVLVIEIIDGRIKDIYDNWVHTVDIRRHEKIG